MYEGVLHRVSCFITLEEDKSAYVAKDNEMKSLVTAKAVGAYHESQQHSKYDKQNKKKLIAYFLKQNKTFFYKDNFRRIK